MRINQITSIIIFMNCILVSLKTFAQQELDKAHFKFYYDYTWQFDTLKLDDKREGLIILQIGQNISKSYSYSSFYYDSLMVTPDGQRIMMQISREVAISMVETGKLPRGFVRGGMGTRVYKNHPEGQVTVTNKINNNHYIYKDELHSQNWQIVDSTKTILDYTCQMAVSNFRGRTWTAWFALEIPINDGPWKLSGLPGLIMEAYDTKKHFHFTIVGIETVENEPIVFSPAVLWSGVLGKYEETTRIKYFRGLYYYLWNSSAFMNAELGTPVFDESSPNRRYHDLIERDYK